MSAKPSSNAIVDPILAAFDRAPISDQVMTAEEERRIEAAKREGTISHAELMAKIAKLPHDDE